jgi:hypothetical protein
MSFDNQLRDWVSANLAQPIPDTVKAFSFNLFELPEDSEVKFGIELVGADRFAASDSDWACNEVWEPAERRKELPKSFTGSTWEQCLENVRTVLLALLANDGAARTLKASYGIGLGFVDGELEILWQP